MEWTNDLTRLADFAANRGIDRNAVTQYVRYHPEIFSEHIVEYKRSLYGDKTAMKALDKKYPLPKPVEIIKDPEADELRRQVIKLQEKQLAYQEQIIALNERAIKAESAQALLEDKNRQIDQQEAQITSLQHKIDESQKEIMLLRDEKVKADVTIEQTKNQVAEEVSKRQAIEEQLSEIKNMSWFQRIFWKG